MLCQFFGCADYGRSLRRRRLAGAGLLALGALGCLCYALLLRGGSPLPDYARSFYLGFSCGLALAGAVLLLRAQRLLAHPQEQKRARVREQDEREQSITLRAFALAGLITFYLCAAALLVAVAVDRTAAKALLAVMAVYAAAFLAARWALAKRM